MYRLGCISQEKRKCTTLGPQNQSALFLKIGVKQSLTTMKKGILTIWSLLILFASAIAQPSDFEDLLLPFVDGKYEKVLMKAEKYTLDETTKKEPLPYLFMSMSFYEISMMDDEKMKTKYPDAFKNAVKSLTKYAKLDKEMTYASEYQDFFASIRKAIISEGETHIDQMKWTKAKTSYVTLTQIDPKDAGAHLMLAYVFEQMKSKKESETAFATAEKLLKEKTCTVANDVQKNFLKNSIIVYATKTSGTDKAKARKWMDLGMEMFGEDNEYKVTYESL
jgi:tetratricopeptide (TPR) repeat protein